MGGYGSGRWGWHSKKATVEECLGLNINAKYIRAALKAGPGYIGSVQWSVRGRQIGSVGYVTTVDGLRLLYSWKNGATGKAVDCSPLIRCETLPQKLGGVRWWFRCPRCGRRAGILYCRGGAFACRLCHDLTYESCQESHKFDHLYRAMAAQSGQSFEEVRRISQVLTRRHYQR